MFFSPGGFPKGGCQKPLYGIRLKTGGGGPPQICKFFSIKKFSTQICFANAIRSQMGEGYSKIRKHFSMQKNHEKYSDNWIKSILLQNWSHRDEIPQNAREATLPAK